jgi:replication fork protection complex subunit Tof1/Swi1
MVVQLDQLTYFRLLLTLASCADKTEYNLYNVLVLDILHLVFRSVKARELAQDQDRVSSLPLRMIWLADSSQAPIENLTKLLEAEKRQKSQQSRSGMTRHSRFGTTVAVRAVSKGRCQGSRAYEYPGRPTSGPAQAECDHRRRWEDAR